MGYVAAAEAMVAGDARKAVAGTIKNTWEAS